MHDRSAYRNHCRGYLPHILCSIVEGVGYELRCSSMTAAALPGEGSAGVTLFTRLVVRESAISLFWLCLKGGAFFV